MMSYRHVIALITAPSEEVAQQIASVLLENKLAACVNIVPAVHSQYLWQGAIQQDDELLLICKTRADLFETGFQVAVQSIHPYETPEIIALPVIMGSKAYLDWIDKETKPPSSG